MKPGLGSVVSTESGCRVPGWRSVVDVGSPVLLPTDEAVVTKAKLGREGNIPSV